MSDFMLFVYTNVTNVLASIREWLTANPARVRMVILLIVAVVVFGLLVMPEVIARADGTDGQASGGS